MFDNEKNNLYITMNVSLYTYYIYVIIHIHIAVKRYWLNKYFLYIKDIQEIIFPPLSIAAMSSKCCKYQE